MHEIHVGQHLRLYTGPRCADPERVVGPSTALTLAHLAGLEAGFLHTAHVSYVACGCGNAHSDRKKDLQLGKLCLRGELFDTFHEILIRLRIAGENLAHDGYELERILLVDP